MLHRAFLSSLPGLSASHSSLPLPLSLSLFFSFRFYFLSRSRGSIAELAALRLSHAHAGGRACVRACVRACAQPAADERIRACAYPKYHRAREKKIGDRARARTRTHARTYERWRSGRLGWPARKPVTNPNLPQARLSTVPELACWPLA